MVLMYQFVNISIPAELAHWTAFIFALRLLYRKSSIAPKSLNSFDQNTGLSREKAILSDDVILVYQNYSKTNQKNPSQYEAYYFHLSHSFQYDSSSYGELIINFFYI